MFALNKPEVIREDEAKGQEMLTVGLEDCDIKNLPPKDGDSRHRVTVTHRDSGAVHTLYYPDDYKLWTDSVLKRTVEKCFQEVLVKKEFQRWVNLQIALHKKTQKNIYVSKTMKGDFDED